MRGKRNINEIICACYEIVFNLIMTSRVEEGRAGRLLTEERVFNSQVLDTCLSACKPGGSWRWCCRGGCAEGCQPIHPRMRSCSFSRRLSAIRDGSPRQCRSVHWHFSSSSSGIFYLSSSVY